MVSAQPDLTQTMVPLQYQCSSDFADSQPNYIPLEPTENIYDKPDINYDRQIPTPIIGQPYAESSLSNHSVSNHSHSSHHSCDRMTDKNTIITSAIRPPSFGDSAIDNCLQLPSNIDSAAVVYGTFSHMGGRLVLQESGN